MNKKNIIWAGGLIIIIIVGWFLFKGSNEQQVSKLDVVDTVGGFYDQWLKAVKEPASTEPSRKVLAESPILSKTLSERLVKAQKDPNIVPDPVLCQSKTPEKISTRVVYENAEAAQALVLSTDKKVTEQALVTLKRLNDGWYIDNIECSGGEFAPQREFSFEREGYLLKGSMPKPYDPKNWHLVFEEEGVPGHAAPLFFDSTSECTALNGDKAPCKPDQFKEVTKAFVQGQMSERGVVVKFLKLVK